jgi:hypothetical protein
MADNRLLALGALAGGLLLAGCGGETGLLSGATEAPKSGAGLASVSAGASGGRQTVRIDCPIVQVEPGAASHRVGGESASSVRYQISIGEVARECEESGGQLRVRVGVETRTVIGPAGSAGTYTAPLTISVRRTSDEKTLVAKTYSVGGAAGADRAGLNSIVTEPLSVPYINERAADDYEIVLAFGRGGVLPREARRARRHR